MWLNRNDSAPTDYAKEYSNDSDIWIFDCIALNIKSCNCIQLIHYCNRFNKNKGATGSGVDEGEEKERKKKEVFHYETKQK